MSPILIKDVGMFTTDASIHNRNGVIGL